MVPFATPRAGTGRVFFRLASAAPADLLAALRRLRCTERIFVLVTRQAALALPSYKGAGNAMLVRALEAAAVWQPCAALARALAHVADSATLIDPLTRFRVSLKLRGRAAAHYTVPDLSHVAARALSSMLGWVHDPRRFHVEIMLHVSDASFVAGIPLPACASAHHGSNMPGLRATTAHVLLRLAGVRPSHPVLLLDPMCGRGALPIAAAAHHTLVLASDAAPVVTDPPLRNMSRVGCMRADTCTLPFRTGTLDAVVCDVPFGGQHVVDEAVLVAAAAEWVRVLRPSGVVCVLTRHAHVLEPALEQLGWRTERTALRLGTTEAAAVVARRACVDGP